MSTEAVAEPLPLPKFPPLKCLFPLGLDLGKDASSSSWRGIDRLAPCKAPSSLEKLFSRRNSVGIFLDVEKATDCRVVIMDKDDKVTGTAVANRLRRWGLQVKVTLAERNFKNEALEKSLKEKGTEIACVFLPKQVTPNIVVDVSFLGEKDGEMRDWPFNKTIIKMIVDKFNERRELVLGKIPDLMVDIAHRFNKEEIGEHAESLFSEFVENRLNMEAKFMYRTNNGIPVLESQVSGFALTPEAFRPIREQVRMIFQSPQFST